MIIKEIVPELLKNYASATFINDLETSFSGINFSVKTSNACIQDKLTKKTADWDTACSQTFDLRNAPDFSFRLQATGGQPFSIYTKGS